MTDHQDQADLEDQGLKERSERGLIEGYMEEPEPFDNYAAETYEDPEPTPKRNPMDVVEHVEVRCEAILGKGEMTVGQLAGLKPGDVVKLDRNPADPVDVRVNGKTIARGEVVAVDGRFAVRLTQVG